MSLKNSLLSGQATCAVNQDFVPAGFWVDVWTAEGSYSVFVETQHLKHVQLPEHGPAKPSGHKGLA